MTISIIGSGHMGKGIGARLVSAGYHVQIHDRNVEQAQALASDLTKLAKNGGMAEGKSLDDPLTGEVVIFALPYTAIEQVVKEFDGQLESKIVVDISNPVDFQKMELVTPAGSSGAEEIAKHVPKSTKVVKAFNTTFAGTLLTGSVGGKQLDVFIAGDDAKAKEVISKVAIDAGLRPLDLGPLAHAHFAEVMGLTHMLLQKELKSNWMSALKFLS